MKFLIVCALALVSLPASTFAIVNGKTAAIGQFPYLCRIVMTDAEGHSSSCGAGIIGITWVLTAAHCVRPYVDIEYIDAYLGTNEREPDDIEPIRVTKDNIIWHEKYSSVTKRNDIALVKLPPITFNDYVQPVMLPPSDFAKNLHVYDNKTLVLSGWGRLYYTASTTTDEMQFMQTKGISIENCKKRKHKLFVNQYSNICTESPYKAAFCSGDSGGPLTMTEIENNRTYMVGIVSLGTSDSCGGEEPDLFTRVDYYLDWIYGKTRM